MTVLRARNPVVGAGVAMTGSLRAMINRADFDA
jgi:hypothetical protein